jgi:hypothetical protein
MRARRRLALAALVVTALAAAGCGDDDDGDDGASRDEYVEAIVAAASSSESSDEEDLCLAESFVDGYGADALADAGLTPEEVAAVDDPADLDLEFSDAQADAFYDGLSGCADVRGLVVEGMVEDASAEEAACIEANVTDDLTKLMLVTIFTEGADGIEQNPEVMSAVVSTLGACLAMGVDGS